jgi:hypothetical protein
MNNLIFITTLVIGGLALVSLLVGAIRDAAARTDMLRQCYLSSAAGSRRATLDNE